MSRHTRRFIRPLGRAVVLAAFALLFAEAGRAQTAGDALPYSRGYLLTGTYVVGALDLTEPSHPVDANGFSTGTIPITGVPQDAEIVAAYLYWETITNASQLSQASGARFRGNELLLNDAMAVKKTSQPLGGSTAGCWSPGGPFMVTHFRADVLRLLPIRLDTDDQPTGRRIVNSADLTAHGHGQHTVTLPTRKGNAVPESAGASLVIIYRDPTQPLRKVVVYDGMHIQSSQAVTMTQTLQGIYRSSTSKSATITHITASSKPNSTERLFFNSSSDVLIAEDPFTGGNSSQRSWNSPTYDVSALMTPGNKATVDFGETATTKVDRVKKGGYDCRTWGAIIFSTAVADVDHDGLPDGLEDAPLGSLGFKDPPTAAFPAGQPLPNLAGMGASSARKDLFIEFNAMRTLVAKPHGSPTAPYPASPSSTQIVPPHTHMPTPEVLKRLGDLYAGHGITPHFDVGDWQTYKALGVVTHTDWIDDYTSDIADPYLVASHLARGGEVIDERACDPASPTCQFPAFPGTVSWKVGMQLYRDSPVADNGEELLMPAELSVWQTGTQRRRFDPARMGLFHYVLNAHARGKPRSHLPCLVAGVPGPFDSDNGTACSFPNPDFHVPSSASGVGDLPGGNALVTLGFWDEHVGRPFVRASTIFHEIGHNLNLWHGGRAAVWGNKALNTATLIEPNCKPTYQSAMSYLFQVHGLLDDSGNIQLDLSATQHDSISETTSPNDAPLFPFAAYRPAWYAPADSALATSLDVSPATRFCNGLKFGSAHPSPATPMARVYAAAGDASIDWNGDGVTNAADAGQEDINFDAAVSGELRGFDDWTNLRLDQIGAGRRAVKFQDGDFLDFGSGDFLDFGSGDFLDFGSGDFLDFGSGDFLDFGSGALFDQDAGDFLDFGSGDFLDFGSGDFLDFGSGDFLDFGSGSERQELDFESALALGRSAPHGLTACVIGSDPECAQAPPFDPAHHKIEVRWQTPPLGHIFAYEVSRKRGAATSADPFVVVATSSTARFADGELPDGIQFTYRTKAEFDDETPHAFSGFSESATEAAVNNAPVANDDGYTSTSSGITVSTRQSGVLGNDVDVDSPAAVLRAVLVSGPSRGALVLNADGSFTYQPQPSNGAEGLSDSFRYKVDNGRWNVDPSVPMSADSNIATVVITLRP